MRDALTRDLPGFDLLHLHSLYLFHDWAAGSLARRLGKPYLVRPHGTLDPYIFRRRRLKKAIFDLWFQDRVLRDAAAVHYTAEEEMRLAEPYVHGAPGVVIPNGVDPGDYAELPAKGSFRARHPEIGDRRILLFLGRINFKKGLDILANAVGRLKRDDLHLVIAGPDGGYLAETRRFVADAGISARTTFAGMLMGQEKLAAFADASLFLLPSYSENFGISVVEAMACGVPVLISDRVNIWREVVADGAGRAAPCDAEAVARQITEMLAEPAALERMGAAGRAAVAARYDWVTIALRLEQVYEAVIAKRREFN
jgi:glycosyltransferase involved in cell wall biosynthesis